VSVKPRTRIFLLMLAVTLALPATASANPWASIFALPPCVADLDPLADAATTDDTIVSSGWVKGPHNVTLRGTGVQGFQWRIGCDDGVEIGATAQFTGTGAYSFLHRAQKSGANEWTPWKEDVVKIDSTPPVDDTTVPAIWHHDVATITLTGNDGVGQSGVSHMVYELDGDTPAPAGLNQPLKITANGTHTLRTKVVDMVGNESAWTTQIVQVDSAGPVDTTSVPAGWVTTPSVDVNVAGTDAGGSGVTQIEWQLVEDARSATVAGAGPVVVNVSGEGVHTLRTRLTDGDLRTSGWKVQAVRIDTVLPSDNTTVSSAWLNRTRT